MTKINCVIVYLFTFLSEVIDGNLNVFLSQNEVKKLLGLDKELYYVRDGIINKYAMGFLVPVPNDLEGVNYSWFTTTDLSPPHYKISASSSHPGALQHPRINISTTGIVPLQSEVWRISLDCTGAEAAEVTVTLDITISEMESKNPNKLTKINIRHKKICLSTISKEKEMPQEGVPAYMVFFVGVGGCLTLLVIIITIAIVTWVRGSNEKVKTCTQDQHKDTRYTPLPSGNNMTQISEARSAVISQPELRSVSQLMKPINVQPAVYGDEQGTFLTSTIRNTFKQMPPRLCGDGMTSDAESRVTEWVESLSHDGDDGIQNLAVDRQHLTLGDLLLEGTFGRIYQGCLTSAACEPEDVMVKTIAPGSSDAQANFLVQEGSMLYPLKHKHLVSLLATTYDGTSPMMIYPYTCPGNLKKWLLSCHQAISTHQTVCMGLQLLIAIKHIHKRRIIHKDVAARNCYLTPTFSIKLCDPALSRDLFPNDYHCLGDNENRPVKWMSMESISNGQFSRASDVWSWGVTLWEILTRSQQPFPNIDPFEMESYLAEGFRLHQPVNCPDQLYTVMVSCWAHTPHHRATIQTLYNHLLEFSNQLQQFV